MALVTSAAASLKNTWGFSPQSIPGLQLWLDGADTSSITGTSSSVSAWRNKGASGGSASTTNGTISSSGSINGRAALSIGTLARMTMPSLTFAQTSRTVFVVATLGNSGSFYLFLDGSTNNIDTIFFIYNGDNRLYFGSIGNAVALQAAFPGGSFNAASIISGVSAPATNRGIYVNGTAQTLTANTGGTYTTGTTTTQVTGNSTYEAAYTLGELMLFDGALTTPQRQQVEGYLAAKWGLKANLPATHPYSTGSIIPFNRPFYPTDIPGCSLWLDGADRSSMVFSGTTVTTWRDKSGNGGATAAYVGTPTLSNINNVPAVFFNSSSYFYGPTTNTNRTLTCYVVATMASSTPNNAGLFTVGRSGYDDFRDSGSFPLFVRYPDLSSVYSTHGGSSGGNPYYNSTIVNTGFDVPFVIGEMVDGTNVIMYLNGNTMGSVNNPQTDNFAYTTYVVGARYSAAGPGPTSALWNGLIGEIILFNTSLATQQRQQVEQYLAWKWGLVANLPPATSHIGKLLPAFSTNFTPKSITGCALWLDAMDQTTITFSSGTSNVATWNDKSGSGFNMTGFVGTGGSTIPSYSAASGSSPPGVVLCSRGITNKNFFASSVWNSSLTVPTATHCLIAVHNPASTTVSPGDSSLFRFQGTGTTAVTGIVFPQYLDNNPAYGTVYNNNKGTGTINYNNSVLYENSTAGSLNLITANIAATSQFIYKNGTQQSSYTSTITNVTSDNLSIGCQNWTNINGQQYDFYSGTIHEMFVFNTTLTTSQRQQVEGYLAWKWGLQSSLPSTHAYAKFSP
jgi:hypothetical protein